MPSNAIDAIENAALEISRATSLLKAGEIELNSCKRAAGRLRNALEELDEAALEVLRRPIFDEAHGGSMWRNENNGPSLFAVEFGVSPRGNEVSGDECMTEIIERVAELNYKTFEVDFVRALTLPDAHTRDTDS